MCGRFILLTDLSVIVESFSISDIACDYRPDGNISPGQQVAAVIHGDDKNRLVGYRWGLIPSWAKDPSIGNRMFNARAETVAEKPSFARAFQKRRCLIPAEGFYEWQKTGKTKSPLRFSLKSGQPFGFAGLYETWISPGKGPVSTCTIITTEANELIRPIHDRMPVIVPKDRETFWIDPDSSRQKELLSILKPYPSDDMRMSDVDANVCRIKKVDRAG
ncbi:MAG: SOS response-associated peptidase [Deltaproteobacteria bacterium]|nr:SOS response-associated peptidase [Deltaproteobacteria bacterium]